ncbi:hypothetical protein L1286_14665 [Pseudoalteromonas sp. SMS1]|uniref:hypothetical protein n=1 Tax=Pseudoalteromonas sp. SMS1 TaxID=2908894 RepID=UPI001F414804|nr:hypothetical protein [Pseudoalteromonas sp. SMS1]MCF2858727.1 hypothetical protein [Pseudoalteromonas sp. SMS1]
MRKPTLIYSLSALMFIISIILDFRTGLEDYKLISITVGFISVFIYIGYKAAKGPISKDVDVAAKAARYSVLIFMLFGAGAIWYLIEPLKIVNTGRYKYHSWTFGSFLLSISLFCLYVRLLMLYKLSNKSN